MEYFYNLARMVLSQWGGRKGKVDAAGLSQVPQSERETGRPPPLWPAALLPLHKSFTLIIWFVSVARHLCGSGESGYTHFNNFSFYCVICQFLQ